MTSLPDNDLDALTWLVNNFARDTPGVSHAAVVSTDGLLLCRPPHLPREPADRWASITAGLLSLTAGAARVFEAGEVSQIMIEMGQGYLFVASISKGSCLSVLAANNCETGMVGHAMALLIAQLGKHLTPPPRTATGVRAPLPS